MSDRTHAPRSVEAVSGRVSHSPAEKEKEHFSDPKADEAALRAGHRARLRARFLADPSALSDSELLELALGHVYLRRDNKMLAKSLIKHFGSIAAVLSAGDAERRTVKGCGEPVDSFCALIREIIARTLQSAVQKKRTMTLDEIVAMGKERLRICSEEEAWVALLDKQNRLLIYTKIHHGYFDRVALEPLEIVELMLRYKASSLVLMHNHPSGSFRPSLPDRELTSRIDKALHHLGLHLHDHVDITSEKCYSIKLDRCL
ncbi:MAG: RadC family protein [Mailhella sp.]|nr:RadC family protein [Mailhella sp.]